MKCAPTVALLITLTLLPVLLPAQDQQATARQLDQLRSAIAELEREQARKIERRDDGVEELRTLELSLAGSRKELAGIDQSIASQTARLAEIGREQDDAVAQLDGEQDALGEQVRMSYMTGSQELVRLLLSQDRPADFGRMLVYYDYLNRHRATRIASVSTELERLNRLAAESQAVRAELENLRTRQTDQLRQLEAAQLERQQLVASLDAEIDSSGSRIEQMRAQEAELTEVIDRLSQVLEGFPVNSEDPFAAHRGKLPAPVEGRILASYGDSRAPSGEMRWDGLLIGADAGTTVRAVYHGQVVHAQWLAHLGLVMILDHGDGYMSIYGHNSALLHDVGDWVRAGDAIAEVGNTGGQSEPALYFVIAHNGERTNPDNWLQ